MEIHPQIQQILKKSHIKSNILCKYLSVSGIRSTNKKKTDVLFHIPIKKITNRPMSLAHIVFQRIQDTQNHDKKHKSKKKIIIKHKFIRLIIK